MTPETKVFVSYAHQDRDLAEELIRRLRLLPVQVWSDDQLKAGENWQDVLRSWLRDSQYFVLLLTPKTLQSTESSWVMQELGAAWALGKTIIPVVTDRRLLDRLPVDLTEAQSVNADDMDRLEEVFAA
jgi:predicted nucleotide-binding protein